jgi:hypothetical protein
MEIKKINNYGVKSHTPVLNTYRRSGIIQSYPQFLAKMSYWHIIIEQLIL